MEKYASRARSNTPARFCLEESALGTLVALLISCNCRLTRAFSREMGVLRLAEGCGRRVKRG